MPPTPASAVVTIRAHYSGVFDIRDLDAADHALLRDAAPAFERAVPALVAACKAQIQASPAAARCRADRSDINDLVHAQARHWITLFAGRFDTSYADSARAIATMHRRLGFCPHWLSADHGIVTTRFCAIAAEHAGRGFQPARGRRVARLTAVVMKTLRLDAEYTVSAYNEGSEGFLTNMRAPHFGQAPDGVPTRRYYGEGRFRANRTSAIRRGVPLPASAAAGLYVI